MPAKSVLGTYASGSQHWVGDGFPVRNLFPSNGLRELSPFIMLDYAGPITFAPSPEPRGVHEHPHRGFETVTIVYQGSVEHRDSAGNSGIIHPGDVQWMTAASGLVHEEMHAREFSAKGGTFELVQLWVNLPAANKMSAPGYQGLTKEQIPVVQLGEEGSGPRATARLIAGELAAVKGAARTFTPINVWDVNMPAGAKVELPLPDGHTTAIVLLRGKLHINGNTVIKGEAQLVQLSEDGDHAELQAEADSLVLVLTGEPIHEPVASYGPFVMNTQQELRQAVLDYQAGKMGHLTAK